jgi:hypothetical protein
MSAEVHQSSPRSATMSAEVRILKEEDKKKMRETG